MLRVGTTAEDVTPADHMLAFFLHRGPVSPHAEEWEMLEHPTHAGGVPFRIADSSDGVEGEANAEKAPDYPVRDAVAEEIEEEPRAELKNYIGLRRLRLRRMRFVREQFYLAATVQNLKRLVRFLSGKPTPQIATA